MSNPQTGLLLVMHAPLATAFSEVLQHIYKALPAQFAAIDVPADAPPAQVQDHICQEAAKLDSGNGVIVLSDIFGATPCNCATRAAELNLPVLAGVSLPLLLKAVQHRNQPAAQLAQTLMSAAPRLVVSA